MSMPLSHRAVTTLGVTLATLALACTPAAAQRMDEMQAHFGQLGYRLYCAGCHSPDGRGNAAAAEALGVSMGDLTQLRRDNGGAFPADELTRALAGQTEIAGHRALAIPPWAEVFAEEFQRYAAQAAVDPMVARRIAHLVAYIESLQR